MSKQTAHHERIDELIESARETMHQMIDSAVISGAITEEMENPYEYVLAKAVITIWGDQRNYAPRDTKRNSDIKNLSHFI